jgi:hypothetical protein
MEYVGPIEIKVIPGKGRGVFATQKIPKGKIIVVEKAIAINKDNAYPKYDPLGGYLEMIIHASNKTSLLVREVIKELNI